MKVSATILLVMLVGITPAAAESKFDWVDRDKLTADARANLDIFEKRLRGTRWYVMYCPPDVNQVVSYDPTRVAKVEASTFRIWYRVDMPDTDDVFDWYLEHKLLNCRNLNVKRLRVIDYDKNALKTDKSVAKPKWEELIPGSVEEGVGIEICRILLQVE